LRDTQSQPAKPSKKRSRAPARRVTKETRPKKLPDIAESADATARVVTFKEKGTYSVEVSRPGAPDGAGPLIWLASLPSENGPRPEILGNRGQAEKWLEGSGGTIGVRAEAGARIMGLVVGVTGEPAPPPAMSVEALDAAEADARFGSADAAAEVPAPRPSLDHPKRVAMHILVHIERLGDVLYGEAGRIGLPEQGRRIEGFAIDPLQDLAPHHVQYRAIFRGGVEGPWITGPNYCGTRGRGEALCGFAVRVAPHLQERFVVSYCGGFSQSGVGRPYTGGESFQAPGDEYLVSMIIEIFHNENETI
jgi:hypothetical protein